MSKPVCVLQVTGIMNRGGAEAMIMNYYRHIDRDKVQFDFVENSFATAAYDDEIRNLGGRIFNCPHFDGKNYFQYRKWWRQFFMEHARDYSIIHGHIGSCASIYLGEAKRVGLFTIAHSHSSGTDHSLKSYLYKLVSYNTRNIGDYFFACSEAAGIDRFGKRVVEGSFYRRLNNAINTEAYAYNSKVREAVRKEFAIKDEIVIGHVGRFSEVKNHRFLIDILTEIQKKEPKVKLLLVGGGDLEREIKQLVQDKGLVDNVIFAGIRSDVNRMMQAMDVFVFPSVYEGLPVTLVEAQTAGLSCVISDRIPRDSILVEDMVEVISLDSAADVWAKMILSKAHLGHTDTKEEIKVKGFDIVENAKWLEGFYLEHAKL